MAWDLILAMRHPPDYVCHHNCGRQETKSPDCPLALLPAFIMDCSISTVTVKAGEWMSWAVGPHSPLGLGHLLLFIPGPMMISILALVLLFLPPDNQGTGPRSLVSV